MNNEYMESMKRLQEQLKNATKPFRDIQEKFKIESTYLKELNRVSDIMQDYLKKIQEPLKQIQDVIQKSGLKFNLSGRDVAILENFYWVIPFELKYENIKKLSKYKAVDEYNAYILKYFNDNRIKRLFARVRRQCEEKDKKEVLRQIEKAFFNEDYAICITTLITILDGLTVELLTNDSDYRHSSYKIIGVILDYLNECPTKEFGYELYLKVDILNNFYSKLYRNEKIIKSNKNEMLDRHLNSHGVWYLNTKIDALRLLNTICFCKEILNEINMQEQFCRKKKDKNFEKKGKNDEH